MPADFEWYTDEEPSSEPLRDARPPVRRSFSAGQLARPAIAVAIVALAAYFLVRNRIEAAEDEIRREILASYVLVEDAFAAADPDLLVSVLSGRDATWSTTQRELVGQGLVNNYPSLGLEGTKAEAAGIDLELAPDLRSADLAAAFPFEIRSLAGLTETVTLTRTLTFRRGSDRWLYAPPDDAFWGELQTSYGTRLTMSYPERDTALADRLGVLLEREIDQLCRDMPEVGCPADLHLFLALDPDPGSVLGLDDYGHLITSLAEANFAAAPGPEADATAAPDARARRWGWQLSLPAPSLIGAPAGESASNALLRGYASIALGALITELNGWECCAQGLIYRSLLDYQLSRLDLVPWGLTADDYELLLQRQPELRQTREIWLNNDANAADRLSRTIARAMVEFALAHGRNVTATQMQRNLQGAGTLNRWLGMVIPDLDSEASLRDAWLRYIYERSRSRSLAEQLPAPADDLLVACGQPDAAAGRLFRLDPAAERWQDLGLDGPFGNLTAIGDGLVAMNFSGTDPLSGFGMGTAVWDGAELRVVHEDGNAFVPLEAAYLFHLPPGRLLLVDEDVDQEGSSQPRFFVLDARACRWPDCHLTPLDGLPFTSPDGRRQIQMTIWTEDSKLVLFDEDGAAAEIGRGLWPFWLDDRTYGYVSPEHTIVLAAVGEPEPIGELDQSALQAALPPDPTASGLEVVWATSLSPPGGRALLFVTDTVSEKSIGRQRYHLVILGPDKALRVALDLGPPAAPSSMPVVSPDGRWLAIYADAPVSPASTARMAIHVLDLDGRRPPIVLSDIVAGRPTGPFSADGEWLVVARGNFLDLVYLGAAARGGEPVHRYIFPDQGSCQEAIWIDRSSGP